jgi:hypothetical protein
MSCRHSSAFSIANCWSVNFLVVMLIPFVGG